METFCLITPWQGPATPRHIVGAVRFNKLPSTYIVTCGRTLYYSKVTCLKTKVIFYCWNIQPGNWRKWSWGVGCLVRCLIDDVFIIDLLFRILLSFHLSLNVVSISYCSYWHFLVSFLFFMSYTVNSGY